MKILARRSSTSLVLASAALVFLACTPDGSQFATAPPPNDAALVVVPPRSADREPQPIPGGLVIPPLIHIFLPGPVALGYQGEDVEPSVIRDFDGVTALAYLAGSATDRHGNTYHVESDIRVFQGTFVGADGSITTARTCSYESISSTPVRGHSCTTSTVESRHQACSGRFEFLITRSRFPVAPRASCCPAFMS